MLYDPLPLKRVTQKANRNGLQKGHTKIESLEHRLQMSTYTVNTLSDAVNPIVGQLTLRQAVIEANTSGGNNTINFDPTVFAVGTSNMITLTQGQLEFNESTGTTTVDGPGENTLSISGGGVSRVMQIDAGATLALSGVTITGGNATIADAATNTSGGGIYNLGVLSITSSNVSSNSVSATAINSFSPGLAMGGGIFSVGPVTIVGSVLANNSVTNQPPASDPELDDYEELQGSSFGGGIDCLGPLTLNGDTVVNNIATGFNALSSYDGDLPYSGLALGGGVYAGAAVNIASSTITGNVAQGGSTEPDYSGGASGNASGGGVYSVGAANISNCTITQNAALGGAGGLDSGSSGAGSGGGVFGASDVTIAGSTINSNSAESNGYFEGEPCYGGGVYSGSNLTILQSAVDNNTLVGGPPNYEYESSTPPSASGGGVYTADTFDIQQSSISNNSNTSLTPPFGQGGGVGEGGGIASIGGGNLIDSAVTLNSVTGGSGYSDQIGDYASFPGADGEGGGIFSAGAITITNSTVASNHANGGNAGNADSHNDPGQNGGNGSGGGIFSVTAVTLFDSTISVNTTAGGTSGTAGSDYTAGTAGVGLAAGVFIASGTAVFDNSIVSDDISHHSAAGDVFGTIDPSSSHNFIGVGGGLVNGVNGNISGNVDSKLGALANNGGPTLTMLPLAGSAVIDAGSNALIPSGITTDQRGTGYPRIVDDTADIGAVEYVAPALGTLPPSISLAGTGNQSAVAGQNYSFDLGSFSESNDVGPFNITVNWGDGSTPAGFSMSAAGAIPRQSHTFASAATDTVTVSVANADGSASTSGSFTVAVAAAPLLVSAITISASTLTATVGNLVELTADVTAAGGANPTGTIVFSVNGSSVGSAILANGVALLRTTALPIGGGQVTASYGGDDDVADSVSSPISIAIQRSSAVVPTLVRPTVAASTIAGQKFNARLPVLLTNTAAAITGTFTIRVYASNIAAFGDQAILLQSATKKLSIRAGKSALIPLVIHSLPATLAAGSYYLLVQIFDPTTYSATAATATRVTVAAPVIKLSAVVTAVTPTMIAPGKSAVLNLTIANTGNVSASGVLSIAINPSADGTTAMLISLASYKARASIAAGRHVVIKLRMKIPATLPAGKYFPICSVELDGQTAVAIGSITYFTSSS